MCKYFYYKIVQDFAGVWGEVDSLAMWENDLLFCNLEIDW